VKVDELCRKFKAQCKKLVKVNSGFTLIEVIIVVAIITILIGISYNLFFLTSKHTKNELEKAYIRSDFRLAQKFLTEDIRYFKGEITVRDSELILGDISYSIIDNKLTRTISNSTLVFNDIYDAKFSLSSKNLVRVAFNDDAHKFAVAIWASIAANTPGKDKSDFYYFVIDHNVFVYGTEMSVKGSTSVKGENSTVVITRSETGNYVLKGNNEIFVKQIYIDNTLEFDDRASTQLGEESNGNFKTDIIHINGDLLLKNGGAKLKAKTVFVNGKTIFEKNSSAKIRADIVNIKGPVTINNGGAEITAKDVYIDGDLTLNEDASGVIRCENLYVKGDIILQNGGAKIDATKKVIAEGDIIYDNSATINAESIYIYKDVKFNNSSARLNTTYYFVQGSIFPYGNQDITDHIKGTRIYEIAYIPPIADPKPIPLFEINNSLRPLEWYIMRDYKINATQLVDNAKIYTTGNFSFTYYSTLKNITIVSNGDIELKGWMTIEDGFLFAPNGKVIFDSNTFKGIVIAKDGFFVVNGGSHIEFRTLDEIYADPSEYPIQ